MIQDEKRVNSLTISNLANSIYKDNECRIDAGLISLENESTFGLTMERIENSICQIIPDHSGFEKISSGCFIDNLALDDSTLGINFEPQINIADASLANTTCIDGWLQGDNVGSVTYTRKNCDLSLGNSIAYSANDEIHPSANSYLTSEKFIGEAGIIAEGSTANLQNDYGLSLEIKNGGHTLAGSGNLVLNESCGDSFSVRGNTGTFVESTCVTGDLVSLINGNITEVGLGYLESENELLAADISFGNTSSGTVCNDVSFCGTSEKSFLDLGTNYSQDFKVFGYEDDLLVQTVSEALENFKKSFKFHDSEISIENFAKTHQSNRSHCIENPIYITVLINVEGDAKHNQVFLIENNNAR